MRNCKFISFSSEFFHVLSPLKFSHTGMASIFNDRLLFTLCATEWPCNLNFYIQLLGSFHFLSNFIAHICMASIFYDRQLFTLCAIICPFKIMEVNLSVIPPPFFIHFLVWPPKVSNNDVCFESKRPTIQLGTTLCLTKVSNNDVCVMLKIPTFFQKR